MNRDPSRFVIKNKICKGCPFKEGQITVSQERKDDIVNELHTTNKPFICHETLDSSNLVCRGFTIYEPNLVVRLTKILGLTEYEEI